jgi:hypothetical protein
MKKERSESILEEYMKVKNHGISERHFIVGRESIILLEGSQALSAHPSDKSRVNHVKYETFKSYL